MRLCKHGKSVYCLKRDQNETDANITYRNVPIVVRSLHGISVTSQKGRGKFACSLFIMFLNFKTFVVAPSEKKKNREFEQ